VFRNSWPQDKTIFAAGVLLFVAGILKCVLKPWQLKRASINSLVDSSAGLEKNRNVSSLDEYIKMQRRIFGKATEVNNRALTNPRTIVYGNGGSPTIFS